MATKKFISFRNLTSFFNNLKNLFATKIEVDAKSDKMHLHSISDVTNLQTALDNKANTSHGTHVSYSTTAPLMDGTASVGSASNIARSDHKHPTDTSRAAKTDLDSHTGNTVIHITSTERTNWNSAYTHSQSAHSPSNAEKNQNAFSNVKIGDTTIAADTTTDTLTLVAGNNITLTPDTTNDKITISAKDTTYTLGSFGITASAAELNKLDGVTATATEINYVDGVTSNIQTQLDGKAASGHTHNYAGSSSAGGAATSANKLNTNAGSATQPVYFANGVPVATTYTLGKSVPSNAVFTDTHYSSKNVVGATNATSNTATALANGNVYINSVENGAVTSSHKISGSGATTVTTDTSGNIVISSTDNNTTYSAAGSDLGLVKSGGDVTISSGVITVNDDSHNHTIANIDNLQTSLDGKQAAINGGASTITSSNLTVNRALISNGSGKVAVSAVTSTELGYLDGVTSNVQTQLDGKAASGHNHETHSQKSMSNTDLNTIKTAGWYYGYTGMTNAPAQQISVMEVLVYSQDWIVQRFIVVNGAEYIRHWHSANTWSNWKTNVDSGNIGSQSVNYATSAGTATNVAWSGVTSKPSYYDAKAIKSITRSGTTFTYTCMDGTTGTFTQQDNNTTYSVVTTSANGLMSSTDKSKLDGIVLATVSEVETYLGI